MYITENKLIPKNPNLLPQKDTDSLVKYLKQSPESDSLDPPDTLLPQAAASLQSRHPFPNEP